jgi:hypothetical protein
VLYQSLIGALQWSVTIGRLDINTAVMKLSEFQGTHRFGHFNIDKRAYGYLSKMIHAAIRVHIDESDYSVNPYFEYDWSNTIYGDIEETKPKMLHQHLERLLHYHIKFVPILYMMH